MNPLQGKLKSRKTHRNPRSPPLSPFASSRCSWACQSPAGLSSSFLSCVLVQIIGPWRLMHFLPIHQIHSQIIIILTLHPLEVSIVIVTPLMHFPFFGLHLGSIWECFKIVNWNNLCFKGLFFMRRIIGLTSTMPFSIRIFVEKNCNLFCPNCQFFSLYILPHLHHWAAVVLVGDHHRTLEFHLSSNLITILILLM